MTRTDIRRAVDDGRLRVVRRGWYAQPHAHPQVVSAVAAGGAAGCLTALRMRGVWVPPHEEDVHVRGCESAHRRTAGFCSQYGPPEPVIGPVDDLATALRHAVKCLNDEGIVVVCDSLLHQRLMDRCEIADALRSAPARIRRLPDRCDPEAASGTETMVRLRLRARNIRVRTQVVIPGIGRVDFLVGTSLIIEVDSTEFHDKDPIQRERDRRRDEEAARLGYVHIRFGYGRVVAQWDKAEATVLDVVRRRRHLRTPRHNHGVSEES